jgi:drug/metabolite transporter (DMT)-like permease
LNAPVAVASLSELPAVRRRGQLYVALAAVAWSTAGVLQRSMSVDVATQVAGRALFAALALGVVAVVMSGGSVTSPFRSLGVAELAVVVLSAVASGTFILALNYATVAKVLFIQALAPVAAALIGWVVLRESVSRRTGAAMLVALAGVGVMVGGPGGGAGIGLALSLVMTTSYAALVVIMRHRRDISMIPAICLSQVLVLGVFLPFSSPSSVDAHDLGLMVLLGAGQMGLGLALLAVGARLIPAPEVALITLLEVVLGPLLVWLAYAERPSTATLLGGVIVVAAVVLQVTGDREERGGGILAPTS